MGNGHVEHVDDRVVAFRVVVLFAFDYSVIMIFVGKEGSPNHLLLLLKVQLTFGSGGSWREIAGDRGVTSLLFYCIISAIPKKYL